MRVWSHATGSFVKYLDELLQSLWIVDDTLRDEARALSAGSYLCQEQNGQYSRSWKLDCSYRSNYIVNLSREMSLKREQGQLGYYVTSRRINLAIVLGFGKSA